MLGPAAVSRRAADLRKLGHYNAYCPVEEHVGSHGTPSSKPAGKYKNTKEDELCSKFTEYELKHVENILDDYKVPYCQLDSNQESRFRMHPSLPVPLLCWEREALEQKDREDFVPITEEKKGVST